MMSGHLNRSAEPSPQHISSHDTAQGIIFCCHASIYASVVLAELIKNPQVNVAAVVLSTRLKYANSNSFKDIISIIRHSGIAYALYLAWVTSVYNFVGGFFGLATVNRQCAQQAIPLLKTDNINKPSGKAFIAKQLGIMAEPNNDAESATAPVLLTAMFNQKLSADILSIKELDCINLHPGRLPEYRGVDPVLIALQQRQASCEMTLHKTAVELDVGDIIDSKSLPVESSRSVFWHQYQLFKLGAKMAGEYLSARSQNKAAPAKPQSGNAAYYSWPNKKAMPSERKLISFTDIRTLLFKK